MITAAPRTLQGRSVDGEGVGYYSTDGSWYPVGCDTSSGITISSTYFACAPSTASSFGIATTCLDGSVLPNPHGTYTCGDSCCSVSLIIEAVDPSIFMAYACGLCRATLYRDIPTTASTPAASSLTSLASLTSSSTSTLASPLTSSSSSPSSLGSPATSETQLSSPSSVSSTTSSTVSNTSIASHSSSAKHSWIAGAIIGPVVALAIIASLAFWIWRLKKRSPTFATPVQERIVYYDPSGRMELEAQSPPDRLPMLQSQPVEVPGERSVMELPTSIPSRR